MTSQRKTTILLTAYENCGVVTRKIKEGICSTADEDVVYLYLWDDFVAVRSPVLPGGVLFDQMTPQWQEFCQTTLGFEIPEDLREKIEEKESTKEEPAQAQSKAARL